MHYVIAGLGMLALGRHIGLPALAAGAGALPFMCSGFLWAHAAHLTIIQSAAWLPWLVLAHARALATRSAGWTVAGGLAFALTVLGGHPQVAAYAGLALGLHGLTALVARWRETSWATRLVMPAITAGTLLLGLALAAPQLVPTLAFGTASSRWTPSPGFPLEDTLLPSHLLLLLVPLAYLGTERFRSMDEIYAYVGIGALLLAAAAVVLRRDAWTRYFTLLAAAGLALAMLPLLPWFSEAASSVPLLGTFRASARATLLADFGVAALAGLGLDAWRRTLAAHAAVPRLGGLVWGWRAVAALALVGDGLVLLGRVPSWVGPLAPQFPQFYGFFLAILLAHIGVLEAWRVRWLPPRVAELLTVALILVNLNQPYRVIAWERWSPAEVWGATDLVRQLQGTPGRHRVWNEGFLHGGGRWREFNAGLVDRIEVVSHYSSLPMARFDEFSRARAEPREESRLVDLLNVRYLVTPEGDTTLAQQGKYGHPRLEHGERRVYDLTGLLEGPVGRLTLVAEPDPGVGWAETASMVVASGSPLEICLGCPSAPTSIATRVTRTGPIGVAEAVLAPRRPVHEIRLVNRLPHAVRVQALRLDEVDLYTLGAHYRRLGPGLWENRYVLPRAFLVEEVIVEPDRREHLLVLREVDPRRTAVAEAEPPCRASLAAPGEPPPDAELIAYEPARVRVRTRHTRPALLVLTDAYYAEWGATVDGRRRPIVAVDRLFRGVCVPAGEHEVEFRYRPKALKRGGAVALVAALGATIAVVFERRRRR
ncbi:MAG: YfhO family protein [Candidatus Rokubacteria bacterium]|nr:YfhO family protein [Candidatus Rokubacteria bacterium]